MSETTSRPAGVDPAPGQPAAIVPEQETLPEDAPREAVPNGAASDAAGDDDEPPRPTGDA